MKRLAIAAVLVLAAVGCSTGGDDAATSSRPSASESLSSTTTAPPATTTPPSTTTTKAVDYGAQYLALVAESNCALAQHSAVIDEVAGTDGLVDESDWPTIQSRILPAAKTMADADVKFYEGLLSSEWPGEVQPDVAALATQVSTNAQEFQAYSEVATYIDYVAYLDSPPSDYTNHAGTVRAKLGLPSNVGNESDGCTGP